MPTLAEHLAGAIPQTSIPAGVQRRVHSLDAAPAPARLKVDVLRLLHEKPGLTSAQIVDELEVDLPDLRSALTMLVHRREIHSTGHKGSSGYHLGPRSQDVPKMETDESPEEEAMPRGVYPRKPRAEGEESDANTTQKKPRKKRAAKVRLRVAKAEIHINGAKRGRRASAGLIEANFVLDDMGRVAIVDGESRIELSLPATKRLELFLARTKVFRT